MHFPITCYGHTVRAHPFFDLRVLEPPGKDYLLVGPWEYAVARLHLLDSNGPITHPPFFAQAASFEAPNSPIAKCTKWRLISSMLT